MKVKQSLTLRCVLAILTTCAFLLLAMGAAKAPNQQMTGAERRLLDSLGRGPDGWPETTANLNVNYRMYDLSLAVREQVDFFLTPALLVQEAVSEDVVLTYPEE